MVDVWHEEIEHYSSIMICPRNTWKQQKTHNTGIWSMFRKWPKWLPTQFDTAVRPYFVLKVTNVKVKVTHSQNEKVKVITWDPCSSPQDRALHSREWPASNQERLCPKSTRTDKPVKNAWITIFYHQQSWAWIEKINQQYSKLIHNDFD